MWSKNWKKITAFLLASMMSFPYGLVSTLALEEENSPSPTTDSVVTDEVNDSNTDAEENVSEADVDNHIESATEEENTVGFHVPGKSLHSCMLNVGFRGEGNERV